MWGSETIFGCHLTHLTTHKSSPSWPKSLQRLRFGWPATVYHVPQNHLLHTTLSATLQTTLSATMHDHTISYTAVHDHTTSYTTRPYDQLHCTTIRSATLHDYTISNYTPHDRHKERTRDTTRGNPSVDLCVSTMLSVVYGFLSKKVKITETWKFSLSVHRPWLGWL